jgi:TolA-binding protein
VATKTQQKSHHHELKEDVLVTWAFQAWDRIQQNLRVIGIGLGVIVAVVLAVVWIGHAQARAEGEANRVLAEASSNYWQGSYARAIQLSDQVLSDYKSTKAANDARRMKGDALFWSGSFDSAATLYKDFLSHSPADSPVHIAVQQSLAFALESKKDYTGAATLFEQLVATAPDRNSAADMLLCAARSYAEAGQKDKARVLYQKVVDEYKDTSLYRDADVFLGELSAPEAKDTPHPAAIVAPKPTANPMSNFKVAGQSMGANGNVTVTSLPAPKGTVKKGK